MIDILGHGSQGKVYRGYHTLLKREVAIKQIKHKYIATKEVEMMQLIKNIECPSTVDYIDYYYEEDSETHWIVMDYIRGINGKYIKELTDLNIFFNEYEISAIIYNIAKALKILHNNNIIHNDVKPENITFTPPRSAVLLDFGCSRSINIDEYNCMLGTPIYYSPEKLDNDINKSSDIWALGITLYIFMCGSHPYYPKDVKFKDISQMHKFLKFSHLRFDETRWGLLSNELKDLIRRMLDKNVKTRISLDELLEHPWFVQNNLKDLV